MDAAIQGFCRKAKSELVLHYLILQKTFLYPLCLIWMFIIFKQYLFIKLIYIPTFLLLFINFNIV